MIVDRVETGEILAGCTRANIELVRSNCDGQVDGDHLRELFRRLRTAHGCMIHDMFGCFTVTPDGQQDLDDLAALFVDGAGGYAFFDYLAAPKLAIDMNPMSSYTYSPDQPKWKGINGELLGYGRKIGHAWKHAVFADLRGRIPGADIYGATHVLAVQTSLRKDYKRGAVWT